MYVLTREKMKRREEGVRWLKVRLKRGKFEFEILARRKLLARLLGSEKLIEAKDDLQVLRRREMRDS